jgi:hypothetical protein
MSSVKLWITKYLKISVIFLIIFSWVFSGWPSLLEFRIQNLEYRVPPKIQEARAQAPAPTFVSFSAIAASTGADVTVTLGTNAANDIMLVGVVVRDVNDTITWPSGWTQIATVDRGATSRYFWAWKRSTGGEASVLVDKSTATGDTYAAAIVYSGAITTGDPWEVKGTAQTTTADPSVLTGITTLTDNSLVVAAMPGEDNNNASITTTGTDPAAYTEHYVESNAGADGVVTFSEAARATAGATGNVSVNWNSAIPVGAGGILLALKPEPPTYEQSAYRLFNNTDSTDVGTPLAAQDTAATIGSAGAAFRLRMLLHIGANQLIASGQSFKLQFSQRGADDLCDTAFSGETYADVTAATVIAYNDNPTPTDGAALTANANDPTHGADTIVNQTYEELNDFTNSVAAIPSGQDGKWDFSLKDNSAPANTTYCLRAVKSDGAILNTYTVIPQITTASAAATISCSTDISSTAFGALTTASVFTASPNASTTMSCSGTSSGCTLYVKDAGSGSSPGLYKSAAPTYLITSADATPLSAGAEGYGIQATSTAAGSGGALSFNSKYNKTGNDVGGLTLTDTTLASSTVDVSGREAVVTHKAAISATTLSGSYTDTITYSCFVN